MKLRPPSQVPMLSRWQREERIKADSAPLFGAEPPFTDVELIAKFEQWGTPEAGRRYVFDTRATAPTRKVQSRVGNVITSYRSFKMGRQLRTESKGPEYGAVVRYDFDNTTREFYCQPTQVLIVVETVRKGADGKTTTYRAPRPYTPDILRITNHDIYVDEWKPHQKLVQLAEKNTDQFFLDADGTWRCPERERYFSEIGITFTLRSGEENNPIFVANIEYLADYLGKNVDMLSDDAWSAIEKIAKQSCPMTLSRLQASARVESTPWNRVELDAPPPNTFSVDDINAAIAGQRLFVDLDFDDLTDAHDTVICVSRAQLDEVKLNRPAPKLLSDAFPHTMESGTEFTIWSCPRNSGHGTHLGC